MRRTVALGWPLLLLGAPISCLAQAVPIGSEAGQLPLDQNELIDVRDHPEQQVLELVLGPVSLPAGGPHLRPKIQFLRMPSRVWIHGFRWKLRDKDGRALPDRLMHHFNLIYVNRRELFSPIAHRLVAAGPESGELAMPHVLGVPVAQNELLMVVSMFGPDAVETHDEAYLHIWLDYTPHKRGLFKPRNVYPFYLDVMGPVGDKEFSIPEGVYERAWEGSPGVDGRVLALGAHLHRYAEWLRLEDVTSGRTVWEVKPSFDVGGAVSEIPTGKFWWRGGIRLHRDHVYRLTVRYRNPLSGPSPYDGMGTLGGVIATDDGLWPDFDDKDPDYRKDLGNILKKPHETHTNATDHDPLCG